MGIRQQQLVSRNKCMNRKVQQVKQHLQWLIRVIMCRSQYNPEVSSAVAWSFEIAEMKDHGFH